ncbi:MAG TPA: YidB family protein, partial [Aestuariivirga sp.]
KTLGPDLIDSRVKQTGLSREELLSRLSKSLPEAVDKLTPDGRVPA